MTPDIAISVIVPCHNSQDYVAETLDCLLKQDFGKKYRLYCVDDASNDDTRQILLDYQRHFPEKVEVLTTDSGNLSIARNTAFGKALQAEYVGFCDSDDLPLPDFLSSLYETAKKSGAECVSLAYRTMVPGKDPKQPRLMKGEETLDGIEAAKLILLDQKVHAYVWCKLFSTDLLKRTGIRFLEKKFVYEDLVFCFQTFLASQKVYFSSKPVYDYVIRQGSLSHKPLKDGYLMHLGAYAACRNYADMLLGKMKAQELFKSVCSNMQNKVFADIYTARRFYGLDIAQTIVDAFDLVKQLCKFDLDRKNPLWKDYIETLSVKR